MRQVTLLGPVQEEISWDGSTTLRIFGREEDVELRCSNFADLDALAQAIRRAVQKHSGHLDRVGKPR